MFSARKSGQVFILFVGLILASPAAFANWKWCCSDVQHAGGTAEDRCAGNQIVFANKDQCEAQKKKHDAGTGHGSTCTLQ